MNWQFWIKLWPLILPMFIAYGTGSVLIYRVTQIEKKLEAQEKTLDEFKASMVRAETWREMRSRLKDAVAK